MEKEKGIIKQFLSFVIKPDYGIQNNDSSLKKALLKLLVLFLFAYSLEFVFGAINLLILGISSEDSISRDFSQVSSLIIAIFVGPLIEEMAFRLPLRFSPKNVGIGGAVLCYFFLNKIFPVTGNFDVENYFVLRISISIAFGIALFFITRPYRQKLSAFWKKHFRLILYVVCFTFAFLHIFNFDLTLKIILLTPILTFTQLIGGFTFSFVRMKYGFFYGLIFHILGNAPVLLTVIDIA